MKNIFKITLLISLLFLASCFEIIEEVTLNNDGSGNILFTLNMSKSRTKLNSIMLLDSINTYKVPTKNKIKKHFTEIVSKIKQTKGVSNVKNTANFDDFIFTITCDFTNVTVLNNIISTFSSLEESKKVAKNNHFNYNSINKIFTRSYHYDLKREFEKTKIQDRKIIQDASFTTIYRFVSPILSSKNSIARVSKSKKAIMLKVTVQDIIDDKNTIKNTIQLQ
ncbi:MAG: hypothetical protein L3J23_01255 [Flavobacteriaceae bacterium]|nr:hypothetical protein [Flavobacteriaceae bacterium]